MILRNNIENELVVNIKHSIFDFEKKIAVLNDYRYAYLKYVWIKRNFDSLAWNLLAWEG